MRGKHIIVAVSAGIAAYKAIEVVSRLRKKGAEVKVVMTQNATHIASPLTFGEISGHPVALDMFEQVHQWDVEHIALATWADAYVVVPATANVIGKIYAGIADDMLTTTIMATKAPKYLCPAMNTEMYNNPITQRNLEGLRSLGYHIMDPAEGWLACGITPMSLKVLLYLLQLAEHRRISILFGISEIALVVRWDMLLQIKLHAWGLR